MVSKDVFTIQIEMQIQIIFENEFKYFGKMKTYQNKKQNALHLAVFKHEQEPN